MSQRREFHVDHLHFQAQEDQTVIVRDCLERRYGGCVQESVVPRRLPIVEYGVFGVVFAEGQGRGGFIEMGVGAKGVLAEDDSTTPAAELGAHEHVSMKDSTDALDQCVLVGGRESRSKVDGAAGVALGEARLGDRGRD